MSSLLQVEVKKAQRALKVPDEKLNELKGIGNRLISSMKKEYVECPVIKQQVPFIACYLCPSFVRRYRGVVYCKGEKGPY
ncbi:MAG: hypothetical protein ACP5GH_04480 [Nitrososphaeria archaeon]|jgi:hypothetical protein